MYRRFFKRFFDIILSLFSLILLSPILLIIYVLVIIFLGRPAIFKQERPGRNEKIFKLYKFRTMTDARGKNGKLLPDEKRLTKFGRMLRASSLDELPELFNILKGDMSFVGPRPLLVEYLPCYTKKEHHRHDVRPGLTGLAQVSGRNAVGWDKKFELDLEYVNKITFVGDLKIIFRTIATVLRRSGITDEKTSTMTTLIQERARNNG